CKLQGMAECRPARSHRVTQVLTEQTEMLRDNHVMPNVVVHHRARGEQTINFVPGYSTIRDCFFSGLNIKIGGVTAGHITHRRLADSNDRRFHIRIQCHINYSVKIQTESGGRNAMSMSE